MDISNIKIEDIVNYINKEVNERVIAKRLNRKGYKRINNEFKKDITKVIQKDNNINLNKNNSIIQKYNNDININELKELIQLIEPIKEVIKEYNRSKSIVEVETIELIPKAVTEVKQKLFKIDVNILNKWEQFVLEHKEYKVQQLISLALEEFINKYK